MTEDRVLALAGTFQGCVLAQQLANEGRCDEAAMAASVATIFRIDAPSVIGVYDGVGQVRRGLRELISQFDQGGQDMTVTRMVITVLRLERSLAARADLDEKLQQGILTAQRQVDHFGMDSAQVHERLATLYTETLSMLRPRVMVSGDPQMLQQAPIVAKVRSCLLAAMRSAVLFHQLGGRQWQLLFQRRRAGMLARGMLTGSTLDPH